ncbi:hypothetical protein GJ744_006047 [Endocarpon pusillum]|uniref:Uncharacterized protein n=1 Tax=Endocarpon pusillum TaxID=364733 RepID=A0A8H7APG2_9EURO|nr:hypothetical protein GJ744_006047 [Endocarpon pusillum]
MTMQAAPKPQLPQSQDKSSQSWHGPPQLNPDQVIQVWQALQLPQHTFSSSSSLVSDIGAAVGMPPRRGLGSWFSTCHRISQPTMAECVADWEERASAYHTIGCVKRGLGISSTVAGGEDCAAGLYGAMSYTEWAIAATLRVREVRTALHRPVSGRRKHRVEDLLTSEGFSAASSYRKRWLVLFARSESTCEA